MITVLRLQNELTPEIENAARSLDELAQSSERTNYQITLLGRGMREAGALATAAFTVPIVAAGDAVIKFGGDFETQMVRVQTLAGASRDEVESMRKPILSLASDTAIGPEKLAQGLFVLESYGLQGAAAMDALTVASKMSALGMGETSEVARGLTGILFSYKNENLSAAEAGDILTKTVQLGNMRISELVPAMAKVSPVASAMGISVKDVAAAIATFTHAGVDSAVATTGLRAALGNILIDSAKTEKGFDALSRAAHDDTINMANFKKEIAEKGLTAALIDLTNSATKAGDEGTKALASIFPNIRALTEILGVYKINGDMVVDTLHKMNSAHGTVDTGVKELHKTWQFQWNQMVVELEKVGIALGDAGILDAFKKVLAFVKDDLIPILGELVHWFSGLPDPVKDFILVIAALVAAAGPALVIFGQLAMAFGNISRGLGLLGLGDAAAGMASFIGFLTNPAVLVGATVLGGLALAIYEINKNLNALRDHKDTSGELIPGLNDANGHLMQTTKTAQDATKAVGDLKDGFKLSIPAVADHSAALANSTAAHQTLLDKVKDLTKAQRDAILEDKARGLSIEQTAEKERLGTDVIGVFIRQTDNATRVERQRSQELQRYLNDEIKLFNEEEKTTGTFQQKLGELMFGYNALGVAVQGFHGVVKAGEATIQNAASGIKDVKAQVEALQRAGEFMEAAWVKMGVTFSTLPNVVSKNGKLIKEAIQDTLSHQIIDNFDKALKSIPDILIKSLEGGGGWMHAFEAIGLKLADSITKPIIAKLSTVNKAAEQVGVALATSLGSSAGLSSTQQTIVGVASSLGGAAIAASAWGTSMAAAGIAGTVALGAATLGIGAAVVGVIALWNHWKAGREEVQKAQKAVADFEQQLWKTLTPQQLAEAGGQAWKATVISVRDAYLATGRSAEQAEADVKALWEANQKGAAATQAAIDKINQAFIEQKQDADDLKAAVERYGFTIEELGPAMQRQKLDEQAATIMNDFRLLAGSGIDVDTVIKRMSGSINDFIHLALKTGTEVPESMKPILQRMIDLGLLTDDAGNKITDLGTSGITFSQTMTQGFDRIVKKLDELLVSIGMKLPAAVNTAAAATHTAADQMTNDWDDVGDAADRAARGASPGGVKEIGVQLALVNDAMRVTHDLATRTFDGVYDSVNDVSTMTMDWHDSLGGLNQQILDVNRAAGVMNSLIHASGSTSPDLTTFDAHANAALMHESIHPMAQGGDFLVSKPTLFLAGEGGRERATFSGPLTTSKPATSNDELLREMKAVNANLNRLRTLPSDLTTSLTSALIKTKVIR